MEPRLTSGVHFGVLYVPGIHRDRRRHRRGQAVVNHRSSAALFWECLAFCLRREGQNQQAHDVNQPDGARGPAKTAQRRDEQAGEEWPG